MALTVLNIYNLALARLGATAVAVLGDGSDNDVLCGLHYEPTRDAILRSHAWRFALRWADLVVDVEADSGTSTTDGTTTTLVDTDQAWTVNAYADYYLWITGGTGGNQIRPIASNTATVLTVTGAWATTPDDTSDYDIWENYPPYPWDYQYDLPSDFLRFARTDPLHDLFEIAGTMLKSDEDSMLIEYVRQEDDPTLFDPLFVDALVAALAVKLVMPLNHDKVLYRELMIEAQVALSRARRVNLQEAKIRRARTWNEARNA